MFATLLRKEPTSLFDTGSDQVTTVTWSQEDSCEVNTTKITATIIEIIYEEAQREEKDDQLLRVLFRKIIAKSKDT